MCIAIAFAVITLGHVILSYVGIMVGPATDPARILADQFTGHPAWHLAPLLPGQNHLATGHV